jgi:hypothetical protein
MQRIQAYLVGTLLLFGSATWAALFASNVSSVIALMAIPSLVAGYIYASNLPQYVWGMLLGISLYMMAEFVLYGPVYKVTGLVYGIGFALSLACAMLGYACYRWKCKHQQKQLEKKGHKPDSKEWAQLL